MENNFTIIDNDCYLIDYNYCYNTDNTLYLNFISDFLYILYLFSLPFITFSFGVFLSFTHAYE